MTPLPLISIGLPAYNSAPYIGRALDSLLAQDYGNFELIISDGGSQDDTLNICRRYALGDSRITLAESDRRLWPLANFGRVLDMAHGPFFMWAAHDDYREPNYLSALLARLETDQGYGMCVARYVKVTVAGRVISTHPFPESAAGDEVGRLSQQMQSSGAPWVYGLYRTERLRPIYRRVCRTGVVWFWDHLVILNYLLNGALTGTNDTTIYQVKTGFSAGLFKPKTMLAQVRFARHVYTNMSATLLRARLTPRQRLRLIAPLLRYSEMQVFHWRLTQTGRFLADLRRKRSRAAQGQRL